MYRQSKRVSVLAGLLALALFIPATAYAQEGSIGGTVRDASGGVLPGATIEVRSPALIEGVRSTVSGGNGTYRIAALPIGTYEVRISLPSFTTFVRDGIVLTTGFEARIDADLRVGNVAEVVNVSGEAPTVDVTQARQTTVLTGEDIRDLPTSRNLSSLMVLVPGLNYQTGAFNNTGGVCVGGSGVWCTPNVQGFNAHAPATAKTARRVSSASTAWCSTRRAARSWATWPATSSTSPTRRRCRSTSPARSASRRPAAPRSTSCRAPAATRIAAPTPPPTRRTSGSTRTTARGPAPGPTTS